MKREHVLAWLRVAGYHADRASFTRIYIENRIGYEAAKAAYGQGQAQRASGAVKCSCADCQKPSSPTV